MQRERREGMNVTVQSLNSKLAGFPHKHSDHVTEQHTVGAEAQHLSMAHLRPLLNVSKSPRV